MTVYQTCIIVIWKGMQEGRQGSTSLFQSKEMTSVLGGGSVETSEMYPCPKESEVTRKT